MAVDVIIHLTMKVVLTEILNERFLVINQLDALISQIYSSWNETLRVSDSSSVHRREFFTVHIAIVYVIRVC